MESGAVALAESINGIMSSIAAIELHDVGLVPTHITSCLSAARATQAHYDTIREIDPDRGLSEAHGDAIKALDLEAAFERWTNAGILPDLQEAVKQLVAAAQSGKPGKLLDVFRCYLDTYTAQLQSFDADPPQDAENLQWQMWQVATRAVETLLVGQLVAVIHREATARQLAS